MKHLKLMYLLFFVFNITNLSAEGKDIKLNKLFNELKVDNISLSYQAEQKIWKLWSTHPNDEKLTAMLAKGSELVNKKKFYEAITIFSKLLIQIQSGLKPGINVQQCYIW